MTFDCDDMVRICNKITDKCGMTWVEQILRTTDDNYIPLINWIKSPCRGRGLSYGFYNNATKNNRAEWIHNKTYNVVMNYSFNTLVDLDIDKDGIYIKRTERCHAFRLAYECSLKYKIYKIIFINII